MDTVATVRVIDHDKKMDIMDLDASSFDKLKADATAAGISLEEMVIIHMTNNQTSRFKGTVSIDVK